MSESLPRHANGTPTEADHGLGGGLDRRQRRGYDDGARAGRCGGRTPAGMHRDGCGLARSGLTTRERGRRFGRRPFRLERGHYAQPIRSIVTRVERRDSSVVRSVMTLLLWLARAGSVVSILRVADYVPAGTQCNG